MDGGAAVPGLDVVRLDLDDGVEQLDGEIEVLAVDRGLDAASSADWRCRCRRRARAPRCGPRCAWRCRRRARPSAPRTGSRDRGRGRRVAARGRSFGGCIGSIAWPRRRTGRRHGLRRRGRRQQRRGQRNQARRGIEGSSPESKPLPRGGKMAIAAEVHEGLGGRGQAGSALAGLEAGLGLVDHIDPALAPTILLSRCRPRSDFNELRTFIHNPVKLGVWQVLKEPAPALSNPGQKTEPPRLFPGEVASRGIYRNGASRRRPIPN